MNPADIGRTIDACGIVTNFHDEGSGEPIVLLHGSGPGVSAWQNWSRIIPQLSSDRRVIAPDLVGFGFTPKPENEKVGIKLWLRHLVGFLDALSLEKVVLVGNSFGGALALAMMANHSQRVKAIVLMGTPSGEFEQTGGLAGAYGFEPTIENMAALMRSFPYDPAIVTQDMVEARFAMARHNAGMETIRKLQPTPAADGQAQVVRGVPLDQLDAIDVPVLILHGREDRIIPLDVAVRAHRHLRNSEMHVFGKCGHWVQIEQEAAFLRQLTTFIDGLGEVR